MNGLRSTALALLSLASCAGDDGNGTAAPVAAGQEGARMDLAALTAAVVAALRSEAPAPDAVRVGYTCSKKVGGAVVRNRAKRRLRAAASSVLPIHGRPGWDYVLIGKADQTVDRAFTDLVADLETALRRVHEPKRK